jgi:hypothetical protein
MILALTRHIDTNVEEEKIDNYFISIGGGDHKYEKLYTSGTLNFTYPKSKNPNPLWNPIVSSNPKTQIPFGNPIVSSNQKTQIPFGIQLFQVVELINHCYIENGFKDHLLTSLCNCFKGGGGNFPKGMFRSTISTYFVSFDCSCLLCLKKIKGQNKTPQVSHAKKLKFGHLEGNGSMII